MYPTSTKYSPHPEDVKQELEKAKAQELARKIAEDLLDKTKAEEELEKANKVLSSKPRDLLLTDNILDDSLTAEMKGKNKNQEKG